MPTGYVVKCSPEDDFYVIWSDVVEAPVFAGTREETAAYLIEHQSPGGNRSVEQRLRDADVRGTSAMWPSTSDPYLGWGKECLIYEQRGLLPRASLRLLVEALVVGDQESAWDLLYPFDDETSVVRG